MSPVTLICTRKQQAGWQERKRNCRWTGENGDPPLFLKLLALKMVFKGERGYLPASLRWRVLLQGDCEKGSAREREDCPWEGPSCSSPLKWGAWHAAGRRLHRRFSLEKEGNVSITLSQVALVALHQGHVSHRLDQAQEKDGRHRSLLQETFSIGCIELSVFPVGPWRLFKFLLRKRPGILAPLGRLPGFHSGLKGEVGLWDF